MSDMKQRLPLRMLVVISGTKVAGKANKMMAESQLPIFYQLRGQGTASSEMMDMFGLGSTTKIVSLSMMPKAFADRALARLATELGLGHTNTGIAFTTAISGVSTPAMKMIDAHTRREFVEKMEKDREQITASSSSSLIVAIVNQGFSEEVMGAARQAGARGGTVLHARQLGARAAMNFLGVALQEEKELVMIIANAEQKLPIMKAVGEKCGMHSEAHGIVISTPIDSIAGLEKEHV